MHSLTYHAAVSKQFKDHHEAASKINKSFARLGIFLSVRLSVCLCDYVLAYQSICLSA